MMKTILDKHNDLPRFVKFALVGISGTILDYAVLFFLKSQGVSTILANTCSFSIGMMNNYYWNKTWTFSGSPSDLFGRQFIQFLLVSLAGLVIRSS
jgi:putative flippase GtrA